jgi:pimeloyl-ACP methyl ester carboxylesterase
MADRYLDHLGARLRWRVEGGSGPGAGGAPVVLVHGWALSLDYWDLVAPLLAEHHPLLRYDRRGFGLSTGPYDPGRACDDLLALLDAAGFERACLVGMSQGARVAIHTTIRAPDRVSAVVLDGAPWFEAEAELPVAEYRRLRNGQGASAMQEAILAHPLMRLASADSGRQELLERCVRTYRGDDLEGGWAPVPAPCLAAISRPVLVLNGEQDSAQRLEAGWQLSAAIPGAQIVQVRDAGHLAALDQPSTWARIVLDFVGRHASRQQPAQ